MDHIDTHLLLPLLICAARVIDVSLGTLRTVAVVRGKVLLAASLGFVEICVWVVAISKVMGSLDNPLNIIGYAGGFALGNALGIVIERRLALGELVLRVISRGHGQEIAAELRGLGLRITEFDGKGRDGPVQLLYLMVERVDAPEIQRRVVALDPSAFVVVEDLRHSNRRLPPATVMSKWRFALAKK